VARIGVAALIGVVARGGIAVTGVAGNFAKAIHLQTNPARPIDRAGLLRPLTFDLDR
jgi:hypothetical protein